MKVEYLEPFIIAFSNVLKEFIPEIQIKKGKIKASADPYVSDGVAVMIGITGNLYGRVIYDMNKKTAIKIASKMNNESLPGFNSLVRSTINELANICSGNAMSLLMNKGYNVTISPPTLFTGEEVEISDFKVKITLIVPLETNYGEIKISLAITGEDRR